MLNASAGKCIQRPKPKNKMHTGYNTSAFDSLYSIFLGIYLDVEEIKEILDQKIDLSMFCSLLKNVANSNKLDIKLYKQRTKVLEELSVQGPDAYANGLLVYDCQINISALIKKIIYDDDLLLSKYTSMDCLVCGYSVKIPFLFVLIHISTLEDVGLTYLQQTIIDDTKQVNCKCGEKFEQTEYYNKLVIMDIEMSKMSKVKFSDIYHVK